MDHHIIQAIPVVPRYLIKGKPLGYLTIHHPIIQPSIHVSEVLTAVENISGASLPMIPSTKFSWLKEWVGKERSHPIVLVFRQ